jgi:hypothetical protein
MKILFVGLRQIHFRFYESVLRELFGRGHSVVLTFIEGGELSPAIVECVEDSNGLLEVLAAPEVSRVRRELIKLTGEITNFSHYNLPEHPSPHLGDRCLMRIHPIAARLVGSRLGRTFTTRRGTFKVLKRLGEALPPPPAILAFIRDQRPDVVLVSPFIHEPIEADYIRAAQSLSIPAVAALLSWDNLTSKGTFPVVPDRFFVWNEPMRTEAVTIHAVPTSRIEITGAPTFDFWFGRRIGRDRAEFSRQVGFDGSPRFVTYLCSSSQIAGDETTFVRNFCDTVAAHPGCSGLKVLVRPHPLHSDIWNDFHHDRVEIWPRGGHLTETEEARQDLADVLTHSLAVVGVNTSAFLEAAILDRPCVTIVTDHYKESQARRAHFQHLLDGQFLSVAGSFAEAAATLAAIAAGADPLATQRRSFVRRFIRPEGIEVPAAAVVCDRLEQLLGEGSSGPSRTAAKVSPVAAIPRDTRSQGLTNDRAV